MFRSVAAVTSETDTAPDRPESEDPPPAETTARRRAGNWLGRAAWFVFRRRLCFGGLVGALVAFCLSLTPSLLPRGWIVQSLLTGITVAIGYGLGSAASSMLRAVLRREPSDRTKRVAWWVLAGSAVVFPLVFMVLSAQWQETIRRLMEMDTLAPWHWVAFLLLATVLAGLFLVIARVVRGGTRAGIGQIERVVPRPAAMAIGVVAASFIVIGLFQGLVFDTLVGAASSTYSLIDKSTTPGIEQPTSPLRSGGPDSLIAWKSLGVKGRDFTGGGPTVADIETFTGEPAAEPIRVYAGLRSAHTLEERVDLAVAELERTNAFDREILAIITTTGTGWVDENVADSLEYMHRGDTAQVALQYSYLPSWISFLVDVTRAEDAGRALITGVTDRVDELPPDERPTLVVFGESLGSFGTESAFDDIDELADTTDGALLVGPTFVNPIRDDVTDERDEGSPAWRPVYENGEIVRFAVDPADLDDPTTGSADPEVVYLQNSSDPITYFSPELLWSRPDWLDDPRGPDVNNDMFWMPIVSFWQLATDLPFAGETPTGHGHRYGANVVDGWAALIPPEGWTDQDTDELRELIEREHQIRLNS